MDVYGRYIYSYKWAYKPTIITQGVTKLWCEDHDSWFGIASSIPSNNLSPVLSTCALTVLVPELLTFGLLAYTIGPLGVIDPIDPRDDGVRMGGNSNWISGWALGKHLKCLKTPWTAAENTCARLMKWWFFHGHSQKPEFVGTNQWHSPWVRWEVVLYHHVKSIPSGNECYIAILNMAQSK